MATTPKDRSSILLQKIALQRTIVETLKGGGHVYTDAERQLTEMMAELARYEAGRSA
jgi:c-di-AMP phosphodiesterase-like protein